MNLADLYATFRIKGDPKGLSVATKQIDSFASHARSQIAAVAGAAAVMFGVRDAMDFGESIVRLERAGAGKLGSLDEIKEKVLSVSDATSIMKENVVKGAASFIALTGDADTANDQLVTFARVALATGSDMDFVARSAAALSQSMGVVGTDFEQAFSILIASGKAGAVELKDVAQVMAKLSAVSAKFEGGTGLDGLAETSSALQLVVRAYGGSASEGSNALNKLMGSMVRAAPKLKKLGVDVFGFDENGKQFKRNFQDIVKDIAKTSLSNDETALQLLLGSKEALAAYQELVKGDEWEALEGSIRNATDTADDYKLVMTSAPFKIKKAWNTFKNDLVRVFSTVVTAMGWALDHIELMKIALMELGFVIAIFSRKAIIAFIAAAAPLILMAALLAIIALLIEDLIVALTGGESALGKVWEVIVKAWKKDIREFFEWVEGKFKNIGKTFSDFASGRLGKDKDIRARQDKADTARRKATAKSRVAELEKNRRIVERLDAEGFGDAVVYPETRTKRAGILLENQRPGARERYDELYTNPDLPFDVAGAAQRSMTNNITINESENPGETQRQVEEALIMGLDATQ